jgi:putative ABC transport system substrate-binding protein
VIGVAVVVSPFLAAGQELAPRTIGWFSVRSADTDTEKIILSAFRDGLRQTGYVEGRNLTIEFRYGDGHYDRLPELADDLVRRKVEVIVTSGGTPIIRAAQAATKTIPIVFVTGSDPVAFNLVKSFNRPGGNSTGAHVINNALVPKRLELLLDLLPATKFVGLLVNPDGATTELQVREFEKAARATGVESLVLKAGTLAEIRAAFAILTERGVSALLMGSDPLYQVHQEEVIALATRNRIATIYEWPEFVRSGGLATYSVDRLEAVRQIGVYVTRILNGASPAELPVFQPTKFELVINLKAAKALGIPVPPSLLARADEVIE